jgi:hypothetical protein
MHKGKCPGFIWSRLYCREAVGLLDVPSFSVFALTGLPLENWGGTKGTRQSELLIQCQGTKWYPYFLKSSVICSSCVAIFTMTKNNINIIDRRKLDLLDVSLSLLLNNKEK